MPIVEKEPKSGLDPGDIVSGLTFILIGVALWLYQADYVDGLDLSTFWPVALVLWGLSSVVARPRRSGGDVMMIVGAFLLANNLGYLSWPMVLVAAGALLVWRGWREDGVSARTTDSSTEVDDGQ